MRCCRVFVVSYEQRAGGAPQHKAAQEADRWLQPHPWAGEGQRGNSKAGGEEMAPLGRKVLLYVRFRHRPREMPRVGLKGYSPLQCCSVHAAGPMHRAIWGEQERAQVRRAHKPWEILERGLRGTAWNLDAQLCYLSMKKLGRTWPVSEKIDGIEAPSSLKARFRNIYVSLDRDMKPD